MTHPFGDLIKQHLSRQHLIGKHNLSQKKLAQDIDEEPSVISDMCNGRRLTGPLARDRVLRIIQWLHKEGLLDALSEANGLLAAAGLSALTEGDPVEAALFQSLKPPDQVQASGQSGADPDRPLPAPLSQCPPCPYPGIRPFKAMDPYFYGRDAAILALENSLYNSLHKESHFQMVVGPSGSGKSSLVFAGLLRQLPRSSLWRSNFWRPVPMRPRVRPFAELAMLLGGDLRDVGQAVAGALTVAEVGSSEAQQPKPERLLLIVDQFEKVFNLPKAEQVRFIDALKELRALESCVVLLVLRADFYADLMDSPIWPVAASERLELAQMSREELRQAITKPAEAKGIEIEAALVERLLSEAVDQRGTLPLLQETLVSLWGKMKPEDCTLSLTSYEEMSKDGRSGLAVALAEHAEKTLTDLPTTQRVIARHIFLSLIQFGEGRLDTGRQQYVMTLRAAEKDPDQFDATLDALVSSRLLTVSGEETDTDKQVDLAHEALITGWPRLQGWIEDWRESEQTRRQLEAKANEWLRLGRGVGGLLDEIQLREAEQWLADSNADTAELVYSPQLKELIQASRVAIEASERAKLERIQVLAQAQEEAKRVERERVLATAHAREQARKARNLRVMAFALFAALLVAAFLTKVTYQQSETIRAQSVIVRAQVLAANAVAQLDVDPERSLLLAMEAVSTTRRTGQPVVRQAHEALDQALVRSHVRYRWEGHDHAVTSVTYSRDGQQLVTTSSSRDKAKNVYVWDASGRLVGTLQGHTDSVNSVAFSRDGKQLATTGDDKKVIVWGASGPEGSDGADKWQPITTITLTGRTSEVLDATFSPDGKSIVVASRDSQARIWSTIESRWVVTFTGHTERVTSASYSPDGQQVVTASWDDTVRVWDVITSTDVITTSHHILKGHTDRVTSARYSPDGRTIVSASEDETVRIWDAQTGEELRILQGHGAWVYDASYSPDGRTIVTASGDRTAKVWDAGSGKERFTLGGHTDVVSSARYSPDGRSIVTVSHDHTVRVWDARDQLAWIMSAVYDKDGRLILSAASDITAKVWNARTERPVITMIGHTDFLYSALFSPDQRYIVTASADKTAKVWDITDHIAKVLDIEAQPVGVVLSQPWITLTHGEAVTDAAYSPSGKHIVTASNDHTAKVWDITTVSAGDVLTQPMMTLPHGRFDVTSATYSPDGRHIVTTSKDNVARIWNAPTGLLPDPTTPQPVITLKGDEGHEDWVFDAAYSPDGKYIVTGSSDRTAKIWDASNGKLVRTLRGHEHQVRRVAYSSDGRFIITASWDATVKIWSAQDGQNIRTLRGHGNRVMGATFKNDGSTIVTAGDDGTMHQHPVSIDDLLALAESRATRSLSDEERSTYLIEP